MPYAQLRADGIERPVVLVPVAEGVQVGVQEFAQELVFGTGLGRVAQPAGVEQVVQLRAQVAHHAVDVVVGVLGQHGALVVGQREVVPQQLPVVLEDRAHRGEGVGIVQRLGDGFVIHVLRSQRRDARPRS